MPQAKRSSTTLQPSEGSGEAWESESSSSDSSGVSSPEHAAGISSSTSSQYGAENLRSCSPHGCLDQGDATSRASYEHINRVLREAHFQSLHNRAQSQERDPYNTALLPRRMSVIDVFMLTWEISIQWNGQIKYMYSALPV
ncbi:protein FAM [Clarias magur]|uniref:Protein FAM n=1 Tax=Clarias magur TaxID=1594786 RepID=A0A8J4UK14_CLAMG|nr:protein FAM [Clarias magur]